VRSVTISPPLPLISAHIDIQEFCIYEAEKNWGASTMRLIIRISKILATL